MIIITASHNESDTEAMILFSCESETWRVFWSKNYKKYTRDSVVE